MNFANAQTENGYTAENSSNLSGGKTQDKKIAKNDWQQFSGPDLSKFKINNDAPVSNMSIGKEKITRESDDMNGASGKKKTPQQMWERIDKQLQVRLGKEIYDTWLARLKINSIEGGVALHSVPTPFLKTWVLSKYRELLLELWQAEDKSVLRVDVGIRRPNVKASAAQQSSDKTKQNKTKSEDGKQQAFLPVGGFSSRSTPHMTDSKSGFSGSPLDHQLTFDRFVEGSSNRMVHAAALTIADDINASSFNPLIFHAGVGLGKTHLLQAIAWKARARNPKARVLYLTAEYFMWRLATAIRDQTALTLKESLRDIDLLLIDDLQFLQGKSIQAEFCHLLNELIDSARQVVVAADRPPSELESLDERVRSRLQGGVTLEIKAPDYELRKEILKRRYDDERAKHPNLEIPEHILHYVASQVANSGRDVVGAFNQLLVQHQFSDQEMNMEELDKILAHLVRSAEAKRVRIEDIQRIVARQFSVSRADLLSKRRTRVIVRPRQIAMYLAKMMTPRSLPEIGRRFGDRDHTTVLHAVRKIEALTSDDQKLSHEIELLKRLILE